jgi:Family of unknown function (DUF6529)
MAMNPDPAPAPRFAANDPAYRPVAASPPGPPAPPAPGSPNRSAMKLIVPAAIGGAVALSLGVYGNLHEGTLVAVNIAGFSNGIRAKAWLATFAFVFALVQLVSALAMYGKLPGIHAPSWTGALHRWSGRIAFLLSVPVAIHCLYALGFEWSSPRVMIHSLLGCFFFGFFTVKMLVLSRRGMPGWALPVFGGLVFTGLAGLWLSSSLYFFWHAGFLKF